MARSNNSFIKKLKAEGKKKKKKEKQLKKEERQRHATGGSLDEMMAYVDEFGNILDEPPVEDKKENERDKKDPSTK